MVIKKCTWYACIMILLNTISLYGMNALKPHQFPWKPVFRDIPYSMQFSTYFEKGISEAIGFNADHTKVNPLQYCSCNQNAIAMLQGYDYTTLPGKLNIPIEYDNGVRGHFRATGQFNHEFSLGFAARYTFDQHISLAAYLPIYKMSLTSVCWEDLTQNVSDQDVIVRERLTDNFVARVKELGCDLDLCGWDRTGAGDLVLMLEWMRGFTQGKPLLKQVDLDGRLGLSLPTGLKKDENHILAIPYGNDGAVGVIFAGGLRLNLADIIRLGFDVELMHLFDSTRERRIQTALGQTDLLFLQKARTHIDWGLTQQINLYIEFWRIWQGISARVDYQYIKRGDNDISLFNNCYSHVIATDACSQQEMTMHNFIMSLSYDAGVHLDHYQPYVSVFAKVPFNGQRAIQATTVGFILSCDF